MREPIPEEFEPSPHYANALASARGEYSKLAEMTETEKLAYGAEQIANDISHLESYLANAEVENARLDVMVAEVNKWNPPSPDHANMKDFMLEQLNISRNNLEYSKDNLKTLQDASPIGVYDNALARSLNNISYYQRELAKENSRVAERNLWIKQLRESLIPVDAHA